MKLPVFNSEVRQPFEEGLVRLPESAFTSVLAADPEEGSTTVEYAIGAVATVHVPKRTWLGVCPAAREPWYCNESTSWEVPAEPSGVL